MKFDLGYSGGPIRELQDLALYVKGLAVGKDDERLHRAADWLEKAAQHICAQGYFGCEGGNECESDHK